MPSLLWTYPNMSQTSKSSSHFKASSSFAAGLMEIQTLHNSQLVALEYQGVPVESHIRTYLVLFIFVFEQACDESLGVAGQQDNKIPAGPFQGRTQSTAELSGRLEQAFSVPPAASWISWMRCCGNSTRHTRKGYVK